MAVFLDHLQAKLLTCEKGIAQFSATVESGKESHPREQGEVSNQARFGANPYQGSNNEYRTHNQERQLKLSYFQQLADKLQDVDDILLLGAGQAKREFYNHLQKINGFKHKKIQVMNSDYVTDNQILETVRNYFNQ
jgi:hypothetical protein